MGLGWLEAARSAADMQVDVAPPRVTPAEKAQRLAAMGGERIGT